MPSFRKTSISAEKSFDRIKFKIKDKLNLFDPVIIYPYYGYGTETVFYIEGRILEKEDIIHVEKEYDNTLWNNLRKLWKRYESDEIPGVEIEAEFEGVKSGTISDEEGFFKLTLEMPAGKKIPDGWHDVTLRITRIPFEVTFEETAKASVFISSQQNCFGVISDVDDTIIKSSAMNTWKKLWIMLTQNSRNREAFEGVGLLYQKLNADGKNPLYFVSGSSWNLYDMLVSYCNHQNIPKAPFFLRNLGLSPEQWIKQDTSPFKKKYISHIFDVFQQMPFILIGDSGQKDPEIYYELYKEHPHRIMAVYIRHVHTKKRKKELEKLAGKMDIPFILIHNSKEILEHSSGMGWL